MKRTFEMGVRNALLPPLACEEIRALALAAQAGHDTTFATLVTRTFWTLLISNHIARYRAAPSQEDCESYRLLAEFIVGDAISTVDKRVHDLIEKSDANEDALLPSATRARSVDRKRFIRARGAAQSSARDIAFG
jgi:hypothetical protein